jgi:uncharacterized protein (TIGR02680 family)
VTSSTSSLPTARAARWQPLRAGLVDVFYYDQEEFWFRDGRLLLRGNNGTGKSKVLALMLPFLLDGELAAYRVEPDGDPKKRMEWNLLLGGEHPHPERLGYTWLELGRRDEDGVEHYCTLGCGMKAVAGRGIADHWFFVTSRRVGGDVALADAAGIALTRDRLGEALGADGVVHRTAAAYRRTVDETLFGLGASRYAALLTLLLSIRAPQLSKRPSERALSDALTEALPPLDQALLADVADAFRSLEEDRLELEAMVEARDAASSYLRTYGDYARVACRRRAAPMRQAQTTYDRISRERAAAEAAHADAVVALTAAGGRVTAAREEAGRLHARDRALRESPEMRSAQALEGAEREAAGAVDVASDAANQHEEALARAQALQLRVAQAEADAELAAAELHTCRVRAREAAAGALVDDLWADQIETVVDTVEVTELERRAAALAMRQQQAVAHVRGLLTSLAEREREVGRARDQLDTAVAEQDALALRLADLEAALADVARALVRAARSHLEQAAVLAVPAVADVVAALEVWVGTLDGPNPLRAAVDAAYRIATTRLADATAALGVRRAEAVAQVDELQAAILRAESGENQTPPVPHTRAVVDVRDPAAGAPLWTLVDFREGLGDAERAGLEAALEASGLLDAWVDVEGGVRDADTHDVVIDLRAARPVPGTSLAGTLVPATEVPAPWAGSVPPAVVQRVLEAIGLGEGGAPVWVTNGGRFRNGALRGAWAKERATYLGRGAREAARQQRLRELHEQLVTAQGVVAELDRALANLGEERRRLDVERIAPDDAELRDAHRDVIAAYAERRRLQLRADDTRGRVADAVAARDAARTAADEGAADLRLPADPDGLDGVARGVATLRERMAALWPAVTGRDRTADTLRHVTDEREAADRQVVARAGRAAELRVAAAGLTERCDVLRSTVGQAVAALQAQLSDVTQAIAGNRRAQERAEHDRAAADHDVGLRSGQLEGLNAALAQGTEDRQEAALGLQRFAALGLVAVALPHVPVPVEDEWGVTTALRLARQLEQELADAGVDDDQAALERVQRRATDDVSVLADALRRHGNTASAQFHEEGITVEVVFRGRATTVPAVVEALVEEVADRRRLLDEQEREVLENHLVSEVASTLQELIGAAEAQVLEMNGELAQRPTSTGMRLRLQWRVLPDGPAGLGVARERLLRQSADAWSQDDRASVGAFLQAQIQEVRARDASGTWLDHLTEALDYRAWHHFAVQRHQGGEWRSATGPASGGERVLAASVPLFAAASSHYASAANPHAPRLVMLDEAFAGVDDDSRAKCLGLLAAFDLDVVMTSEREWGCYPEVPGLAIAQLSRAEGVPAVLVTRWEWDGVTRTAVDDPRRVPMVPDARAPSSGSGRSGAAGPSDDPPDLWTTTPSTRA